MAKTGGFLEVLPTTVSNSTELKKELLRLVNAIPDGEDFSLEIADEVLRILTALNELKFEKSSDSLKLVDDKDTVVPDEFKCPISGDLMIDPVILATGQTYDRPFILQWLNDGHRICPQTQQVLYHTMLIPNHLVREMISHWCKKHGIELLKPVEGVGDNSVAYADRGYLDSLLEKMSSSLSDQKEAAKELRLLTKRMPSFRALFGESTDAIFQLLNPLSPGRADSHPDLQEDLITTILNLSIHDNNKRLVAENPLVIPLLIESLKTGTIETRSNAAAALFTLSAPDSNKILIGKSGALTPLLELLEEGNQLAMKDAASAIFSLCVVPENKARAVREGAVRVILKKIMNGIFVDELLAILAMLANHPKAVEEMGELGAVGCLLRIIRVSMSERTKENSVAILYTICLNDRNMWKEVWNEETANHTLSILADNGTSRARRKADGILDRLLKQILIPET
ncbi:hypothetical protein P3X46_008262 [Hevea brasiliensis]|uniref:RING-type E3 ubiquitin transferase n=1 Tax=Hevea brasiliensis TaxID=3981 RepID=A0ABQ9MKF7_HEVBR|nr:U-box domain-containing protein 9 [Hevea brasiliensis]KAJ9179952.1 hypothetical protein P3X46_008262 [Hevea brasiliensis]